MGKRSLAPLSPAAVLCTLPHVLRPSQPTRSALTPFAAAACRQYRAVPCSYVPAKLAPTPARPTPGIPPQPGAQHP